MIWLHRSIDAPAEQVWTLLTDLELWPEWGPSVRRATLSTERFELGATGEITTVVGLTLPFEITTYEPGTQWAWKVAGIGATDHRVEPLGPERCRVGFGVPLVAAPYMVVIRAALGRIETLAQPTGIGK